MKLSRLLLASGVLATLLVPARSVDKPKVFAIVPKSFTAFYIPAEKGAREAAQKLGAECLVLGSEKADPKEQVQIIRDLIGRGVNGISVSPMNAYSVIGVIGEARSKNIPVITFDSDSPRADRVCYIGTDNLAAGREAGKAFQAILPKGKIAILTGGSAAQNLNLRIQGFRDVLNEENYIEVPGSPFACDDDGTKANRIIEEILTKHPDLDGFFFAGGWPMYASPDGYVRALGKRAADVRKHKLVVVSFDAVPEQLNLLQEGFCTTLIGQRAYEMGAKSIEALNDIGQGKKVSDLDTGVDVISANNVAQFRRSLRQ